MMKRLITEEILPYLGGDKLLIIKGARHVGKTELLLHLEEILKERGEATAFINVEQKRHDPMFHDPKVFLRSLRENYGQASAKKFYLLLNDFHYIKNAGVYLKTLDELTGPSVQIIGTASVTANIATLNKYFDELGDRKKIFSLRHLSFREYLQGTSSLAYADALPIANASALLEFYAAHKDDLKEHSKDFIYWGGYPDVVGEGNPTKKYDILGDIIHRYIEKDISSLLRIENVEAYIQLMEILSHEIGNLLNHHDLSMRLGIHKKTLSKYLDIINDTFTFSFVPPYFTNTKKELAKMRKVYAHDLGIVSYFHHQNPRDVSSLFPNMPRVKNFLYTEIRKMGFNEVLHFYRTIAKAEIDFVIDVGDELIPIKIKLGKKKQNVPVVLKNFVKAYNGKVKKAIVITQDELRYDGQYIFVPLLLFPFLDLGIPLQRIQTAIEKKKKAE